jgi:iron-sulfur cluster repair protein YtfE (RIC family)
MTALDLLRSDHRYLLQLCEQWHGTEEFLEQRELFEEIRNQIQEHFALEEATLHPRIERVAEFCEWTGESLEDHRLIEEILGELEQTQEREEFTELFEELVDNLEDHIQEEENDLFPRLLELWQESDWAAFSQDMLDFRGESKLAA